MQALVLAAGQGKRLQPLTLTTPKAMLSANGKPMLQIILEQLKSVGVTDVVIVVHYLKEKITSHFGDGKKLGINITYVDQKEMKGTGHAVLSAKEKITSSQFLTIAADSLFPTTHLDRLIKTQAEGIITVARVADGRRYGVIEHDGKHVRKIHEKPENPPSNLANFSIYKFPQKIFDECARLQPSKTGEYWLTDAINNLISKGTRFEFLETQVLDIGTPEQLKEAQELAKEFGI